MNNSLNDSILFKLCRDDGQTCVTCIDGVYTIYNANSQSVNFDAIVEYVQRLPGMSGKSTEVKKCDQEYIENLFEEVSQTEVTVDKNDTELSTLLQNMCQKGVDLNASDIHIEIYREKTKILVRVDGRRQLLTEFANGKSAQHLDRNAGITLATYIFTLGNVDMHINDPENASFNVNLKWDNNSKTFEYRSALIPIFRGLKVTLRSLTPRSKPLRLTDMDLLPTYVNEITRAIHRRSGAIIVTGPMGSGKSSLVWAMLDLIDSTARCIHALEDPVEFEQEGIVKTLVEPKKETKTGSGIYRDYAYYAKEQLRHDIDVSSFGELRGDDTTSEFAWKSTTGGLALATLHTNSAIGAAQTLIENMHLSPATVSSPDFLNLLIHTKLVRKLCPYCSLTFEQAEQSKQYEKVIEQVKKVLPYKYKSARFKASNCQCEHCDSKGETGRLTVMEIVIVNNTDREFILNKNFIGWEKHLKSIGWVSIQDHTLSRISKGQVDIRSASEQIDNLIIVESESIYKGIQSEL